MGAPTGRKRQWPVLLFEPVLVKKPARSGEARRVVHFHVKRVGISCSSRCFRSLAALLRAMRCFSASMHGEGRAAARDRREVRAGADGSGLYTAAMRGVARTCIHALLPGSNVARAPLLILAFAAVLFLEQLLSPRTLFSPLPLFLHPRLADRAQRDATSRCACSPRARVEQRM